MRNRLIYGTFVLIFGLNSCGSGNEKAKSGVAEILNIPEQEQQMLKLDEDPAGIHHRVISLRHDSVEVAFNNILKVAAAKDYLYVIASSLDPMIREVFIYTKEGDLVKKLQAGKGAGEYLSAQDLIVNEQAGCIEVLSRLDVLKYSLTGEYLDSRKIPPMNCLEFETVNGSDVLFNPIITPRSSAYFTIAQNGGKIKEIIPQFRKGPKIMGGTHLNRTPDALYAIGQYGNVVYRYNPEKKDLEPFLSVAPVFNDSTLVAESDEQIIRQGFPYTSIVHFASLNDGKRYAFTFVGDKKYHSFIYNVREGKWYQNLFESAIFLDIPIGSDANGLFYAIDLYRVGKMDYSALRSEKAQTILSGLKELENGSHVILYLEYL